MGQRSSTLQLTRDTLFSTEDDDQHILVGWRGEIVGDKSEKVNTSKETEETSQSLQLETSPKPYSFLNNLGTESEREGRKSVKRKLDMTCFNSDLTKTVDDSGYQCVDLGTKRWNDRLISKINTMELVELSSDSSGG